MAKRLVASWLLVFGLIAAGPAAAQPVSSDTAAAAGELIETLRMADQMRAILPIMMQQFKPVITKGNPAAERDYDALAPTMMEMLNARMPELVAALAPVYAGNFTADELRQLTAFFRTPVGQKYLQKAPALVQEAMTIGNKFGEQMASDVQNRMIEELRKRGHKI